MRKHAILALLALLTGPGCDSRSVPVVDGAPPAPDGAPPATDLLAADRGLVDLGPGADAAQPDMGTFCSGPAKLVVDGAQLSIATIESSPTITNCCVGEQITVHAHDAAGAAVAVTFAMLRFPEASDGLQTIDLASPATGWGFFFKCDPYLACGYPNSSNSSFSGTLLRAFPVTGNDLKVTVCASAAPKATAPPETRSVDLYLKDVLIHRECTPGMDQTCNHDPLVSSFKGTCEADGTCTCAPGTTKMPDGKCK